MDVFGPILTVSFGIIGATGFLVGKVMNTIASYAGTIILMEWTFAMIPLLAISTASLIAFVSYLVTLCKYFYISPFVTAWAMATKRSDRIIDFLLAGITIFFQPVLIVLFIYLSLFMHTLIDEFFILVSIEQFSGISMPSSDLGTSMAKSAFSGALNGILESNPNSVNVFFGAAKGYLGGLMSPLADYANDLHTNFIIGAISGLLKIFGGLASSYIAWKLIVNGPSWALGMIGLDAKHNDVIAQGLETNLSRRAFVA